MTSQKENFDVTTLRRCERLTHAASVVGVIAGSLALLGWALDLNPLKSVFPGMATMKANAALGFVLTGISLWLLGKNADQPAGIRAVQRRIAFGCAGVVVILGLATFSQDIFGFNFRIDEMLFREGPLNGHTAQPGRMAPATALNFTFLGFALIGLNAKKTAGQRISASLSMVVLISGLLACIGYAYGVESLYRIQAYSSMAISTAVLFVLLGLGLLFARAKRGITSVITSAHDGSLMARRILPLAIVLPFLFGWARLAGEHAGLYGSEFGVAIVAIANIIVFTVLIWSSARLLNRVDAQRQMVSEEWRESEQRLRLLVDGVTDYAIFMLDPTGHVVTWNAGAERLKGYQADEIIGQSVIRFYPEEAVVSGKPAEELKLAASEGRYAEKGWRVRKDGSRFWASVVITAIRSARGELVGFAKVTRDLTERRQAEATLRRQASLLDQCYDAVFAWELDGPIIYWNKGAEELYGYKPAESLGRSGHDLLRTRFPESLQHCSESLSRTGRWEGELKHETRDGRQIVVESRMTLVREAGSTLILEANRDITQRKHAEDNLRASLKEVKDLQTALDEHAIVAITDARGRISYINDKFCAISKYSREELLGQDHRLINSGHHSKEFLRNLWATIGRGEIWQGEIKNRAKDGSFYWVATTIVPFLDERGKPVQYIAIRADITARMQAEEALREANESLEHKVAERTAELEIARRHAETTDRLKSEFLANMSHEIRTPLNGIIGFSEFLVDGKPGPLNPRQQEYLKDVLASGRHLLQLINDILDLAKVESGKMELNPHVFDPSVAAREVCAVIQGIAGKKRIFVQSEISPVLGTVCLDEKKFKQVLYNLLSNAVKFTPSGGRVNLKIQPAGRGQFCLEVRDTGPGIRPEDFDRVFREFEQSSARPAGQAEGTGLGLALTRKIVEIQNGTIAVESEVGRGSNFVINLPMAMENKIA